METDMQLGEQEEIDQLQKILFPGNDFNLDTDQLSYLNRLGTQGVNSLNGEVSRLNEELVIVEHQTRDMASQNYQIFVQSAQTTNQIKNSLSEGNNTVSSLTDIILPTVKSQLDTFSNTPCNLVVQEKDAIDCLFEKRDSIFTLMEMPWIVRRCLAEERLPDAIKILHASKDFMKNMRDPPSLLMKTCNEVATLKTEVQHALLLKLSSGTIGLSECLQTVSLLRSFFPDDKSLRFRYLQSRMKDISFEEARPWMFDTLTQHRAAFGGDSNHYLSTWVSIQINRILDDLEKRIDHADGIDALMMQATYFGESLARVGADVRGLIIPIFAEHMVRKLQQNLTQSEIQFVRNLHQLNMGSAVSYTSGNPESANLDFPAPDDLNPPKQLISYLPLAQYCNEVLTCLNFIGKCPLTQVAPLVVSKLNGSVNRVGHELESWGKAEWATWESREQAEFNRMKRYFIHLLVPHFDRVVRLVFPPVSLSELTGIGITLCAEMIQIKYGGTDVSPTTSVEKQIT